MLECTVVPSEAFSLCVVSSCNADLSGDVMSIEVEATDMLVDLGEGVEALNSRLSCLHHLAMHTLRSPWDILNFGCLQASQVTRSKLLCKTCSICMTVWPNHHADHVIWQYNTLPTDTMYCNWHSVTVQIKDLASVQLQIRQNRL